MGHPAGNGAPLGGNKVWPPAKSRQPFIFEHGQRAA